jgi:hypothetical protein
MPFSSAAMASAQCHAGIERQRAREGRCDCAAG